jgi:hypothetical protein
VPANAKFGVVSFVPVVVLPPSGVTPNRFQLQLFNDGR